MHVSHVPVCCVYVYPHARAHTHTCLCMHMYVMYVRTYSSTGMLYANVRRHSLPVQLLSGTWYTATVCLLHCVADCACVRECATARVRPARWVRTANVRPSAVLKMMRCDALRCVYFFLLESIFPPQHVPPRQRQLAHAHAHQHANASITPDGRRSPCLGQHCKCRLLLLRRLSAARSSRPWLMHKHATALRRTVPDLRWFVLPRDRNWHSDQQPELHWDFRLRSDERVLRGVRRGRDEPAT